MIDGIKVSKKTRGVGALIKATYPGWTGRKVRVCVATTYQLENYWDGGTRCYVKAVDLTNGRVSDPSPATTSAYNAAAHATVPIPAGVALVEHSIFCGADAGIRIYINPGCPVATLRDAIAGSEVAGLLTAVAS